MNPILCRNYTPRIYGDTVTEKTSGWQLCPKCNGSGYVYAGIGTSMNTSAICDLCNGKKIINIETGLPPI